MARLVPSYREVLSLLGFSDPSCAHTMLFTYDVSAFIRAFRTTGDQDFLEGIPLQDHRNLYVQLSATFLEAHGRGPMYWCTDGSPSTSLTYPLHKAK